jgi:hypothetical protein
MLHQQYVVVLETALHQIVVLVLETLLVPPVVAAKQVGQDLAVRLQCVSAFLQEMAQNAVITEVRALLLILVHRVGHLMVEVNVSSQSVLDFCQIVQPFAVTEGEPVLHQEFVAIVRQDGMGPNVKSQSVMAFKQDPGLVRIKVRV